MLSLSVPDTSNPIPSSGAELLMVLPCVHTHVEVRGQPWTIQGVQGQAGLACQWALGLFLSVSPGLGMQSYITILIFHMDARDWTWVLKAVWQILDWAISPAPWRPFEKNLQLSPWLQALDVRQALDVTLTLWKFSLSNLSVNCNHAHSKYFRGNFLLDLIIC